MASKLRILELFLKTPSPKPNRINHSLPQHLTVTESSLIHDCPNSTQPSINSTCLRNNQNPRLTDPDDKDFVIPSHANWFEDSNLKTDEEISGDQLLFQGKDIDKDMDKVSEMLKKHYPSDDAVVKALNESGIEATNALVSQILKRFSNHWASAFGVFIWAKNQAGYLHAPELYDSMIDILGKFKKFSIVWNLVEEMKGLSGYVSLSTMSAIMRRLAGADRFKDAIDVFRGMEKFGVKKDTEALNILMDTLARERSVEDAQSALLEFKDSIALDFKSVNILIHGYCKARRLHDARQTMNEMEKHGFHPTVFSYTCFINAYCQEEDFQNVEAIFNEMQEKGCKPDVISYTIYMRALGKAKQTKEAFEVFEKMKRNGCVPDTAAYCSLIYVLSQAGRIKDAWGVFENMEKQGVSRDLKTYNTMIYSACAHSQDERALKLLERMEQASCKPDVETYRPLLKMSCRKKRMKLLKSLLSHMFKNSVSTDLSTYALLVDGFCRNGKLKHACFFFQEAVLKGMVPWKNTYKMLLKELERKNMAEMKEKIEKLMSRAKEQNMI